MPQTTVDAPVMTLRETLLFPSFAGATVVAGERGLDHSVTNAMVMEAADIEKWGKPGLLLITSFYALQNLDEDQIRDFFRKVAELDLAGIVFKPERFVKHVPKFIVEVCDELCVPIVQVTPDTKYEPILMDVMGNVIDSNMTLLNRFFDVHREVTRLALEQPSIYDIIRKLGEATHYDVTYFDRANDIRISTTEGLDGFNRYHLEEIPRGRYQTFHYYQAMLFYPDDTARSVVTVLVPGLERRVIYLMLHASVHELSPIDYMAVENYATLLQSELLKQAAIEQRVFNENNSLVHDLLLNRFPNHAALEDALQRLGLGLQPNYQALLVRLSITDPTQSERLEDLARALTQRLKRTYHSIAYYQNGNRIIYLRNFSTGSVGFRMETIERTLSDMHADDEFPPFVHLAALSGTADRDSIPAINDEVLSVYRLFDSNRADNQSVRYEDLGVYKLLVQVGDLNNIDEFIDPRLVRMRKENPAFFETLQVLSTCGFNYKEAANQLYIHPKTIRYRVERVRETYGLDIHDSNDLTQILLAIKLVALLGA